MNDTMNTTRTTTTAFAVLALALCLAGCKKKVEDFAFAGTAIYPIECTLPSQSIAEQDRGYVIELTAPDTIGDDYYDNDGIVHHNCVILYRTRTLITEGEKVSGTMYLDDDYSKAVCSYHYHLGIPEGVCTGLD